MNINAIVMPMIRGEICELKSWIRHCPRSGEAGKALYLSIDLIWSESEKAGILDTFSRSALHDEGWHVRFIDCRMNPDESFYEKDASVGVDLVKHPYGQKSGPNLQFYRTLRTLRQDRDSIHSVLLMEVDAFPLADGWLNALREAARTAPPGTLVAGPRYTGGSFLNPQIRDHLNGNSIYAIGDPDFYDFLDCWETLLLKSFRMAPFMAYDAVVVWYANYREVNTGVKALGCERAERAVLFHTTRTHDLSHVLVNHGGAVENHPGYQLDTFTFAQNFPQALIVHGKCFRFSVHILRSFWKTGPCRHHANIVAEAVLSGDYEQSLLLGIEDVELPRMITERTDLLSANQRKLIAREWTHD